MIDRWSSPSYWLILFSRVSPTSPTSSAEFSHGESFANDRLSLRSHLRGSMCWTRLRWNVCSVLLSAPSHEMGFDGLFSESNHYQNSYKAVFSYLFAYQLKIVLLFYMGNVIPVVTPFKWNDKCAAFWLYDMPILHWGPWFRELGFRGTSLQPVLNWDLMSLVYGLNCKFKYLLVPGRCWKRANQAVVSGQKAEGTMPSRNLQ